MKENAIIIRPLDVVKTYVDFSDIDNIYSALDVESVSTIHTAATQELSSKLGIHLIGFVDRHMSDINNPLAASISGYDYIGSNMLLCKTDDRFNPLPFTKEELEKVYRYLVEGEDALEEVIDDEDYDDVESLQYTLFIEISAHWPKNNDAECHYIIAVPMAFFENEDEIVNIPYFGDAIEYKGYSRVNDCVYLKLNIGEEDDYVIVYLDEEVVRTFDYQRLPNREESYRIGTMKLKLQRIKWVVSDFVGTIHIKETLFNVTKSEIVSTTEKKFINYMDGSDDVFVNDISGNTYYPCLINDNLDLVIVAAFRKSYDESEDDRYIYSYIPVDVGTTNRYHDEWYDAEDDVRYIETIEVSFTKD